MRKGFTAAAATAFVALAAPAMGQEADSESSVYDGDWLSIGAGVGYGPSYDGSDDYVAYVMPVVQGNLGGIGIAPQPGGFSLDFLPDPDSGIGFDLGPSVRMRSNRARQIEDPVVRSLGKLDHAVEVGPHVGISVSKVFHEYDSLSFGADVRWDVAGAHKGMVIAPSLTYFTPLNRGVAVALSFNTEYADGKFADYYYSVTPAQSVASGLPAFDAGKGFTKAGVTLIGGIDLNGNLLDGGLALVFGAGYSRMLGDAKDTPFTSVRGDADQLFGAIGLGYTF
ncbi:structural protein MipA [Croceicoccus estronivorus]|uniref:MipA/OmpV family protein n=1 Tax=Croceicoccus estronivorus TaxID=1172626 RepID=UPI000833553F|nr:MipA/OmpV family protein [Croceicoccus estronivorus]OCC23680.1 structural protein MipA [Croceicoccus estronivorus]